MEVSVSKKRRERRERLGTPEGARRATGGAPSSSGDDRGRFSARRKTEAIMRVLRGEDLDALSRELGVTAATLSGWRDQFLAAGQAGLKSRTDTPADDEVRDLKTLIGELTIDNECLKSLLRAHENRNPLARRRSNS